MLVAGASEFTKTCVEPLTTPQHLYPFLQTGSPSTFVVGHEALPHGVGWFSLSTASNPPRKIQVTGLGCYEVRAARTRVHCLQTHVCVIIGTGMGERRRNDIHGTRQLRPHRQLPTRLPQLRGFKVRNILRCARCRGHSYFAFAVDTAPAAPAEPRHALLLASTTVALRNALAAVLRMDS